MVKGAKCFHLVTTLVVKVLLLWFLLHQLSLHFSVLEAICSVSSGDALTSLMALLKENTSKDVATQRHGGLT
jgi:hypothetical protein